MSKNNETLASISLKEKIGYALGDGAANISVFNR